MTARRAQWPDFGETPTAARPGGSFCAAWTPGRPASTCGRCCSRRERSLRKLRSAGVTDRELRRLRRAGEIDALRPGAYVAAAGGPDRPEDRHRATARAAAAQLGAGTVFSHVTAALLHGLPVWNTPLRHLHVTRDRRGGSRRSRHLAVHAASLDPDEIEMVDGLLVTSVARTLVDLGRALPFEQALVPADAALHRHLVTRAGLDVALGRAARRPGNAQARRVLQFARPGADSPGESRSRLAIHRAGFPPPALQHTVRDARGTALGQVDLWWETCAVVGEFDGKVKYGRALRPDQEAGEVLFAEKRREDALRAAGCEVVRWTWRELDPFDDVAERLRTAFARSAARP